MSTDWCRGFGRYFSLSPVFVGLKCAQASRVSVYLSAFAFLSVVFIDFCLACFVSKTRKFVCFCPPPPPPLFFLSFLCVYHVHSFFCLFCFLLSFVFVFFFSPLVLLFLLHLLRVHSCCGSVCTFASFVDFPFFFWRVSCEGFSPFFHFNLCTGCQGVKLQMYFWVLWSVWIIIFLVELARTEVSSEEVVPSIYQGLKLARAGWCVPLVKGSCNRVTDLEQFPVRITKDEASFDCYLSRRCERKTTTPWSAALRI